MHDTALQQCHCFHSSRAAAVLKNKCSHFATHWAHFSADSPADSIQCPQCFQQRRRLSRRLWQRARGSLQQRKKQRPPATKMSRCQAQLKLARIDGQGQLTHQHCMPMGEEGTPPSACTLLLTSQAWGGRLPGGGRGPGGARGARGGRRPWGGGSAGAGGHGGGGGRAGAARHSGRGARDRGGGGRRACRRKDGWSAISQAGGSERCSSSK